MRRQFEGCPPRFGFGSRLVALSGKIVVVNGVVTEPDSERIETEAGKMPAVRIASDKCGVEPADDLFFQSPRNASCAFRPRVTFIHHHDARAERPAGGIDRERPVPIRRYEDHVRPQFPKKRKKSCRDSPRIELR